VGGPPVDQGKLVDLGLAVHPGKVHQRRLDQVGQFGAGSPVGLLGPGGMRLDNADQRMGQLRDLEVGVGPGTGIEPTLILMSVAAVCQTKGLGSSFQCSTHWAGANRYVLIPG